MAFLVRRPATTPSRPDGLREVHSSAADRPGYRATHSGITGRGDGHSLSGKLCTLGETYVNRWWHVVNDDSRDQIANRDGQRPLIPGRLYPDLLNFAEHHGMQIHGSHRSRTTSAKASGMPSKNMAPHGVETRRPEYPLTGGRTGPSGKRWPAPRLLIVLTSACLSRRPTLPHLARTGGTQHLGVQFAGDEERSLI